MGIVIEPRLILQKPGQRVMSTQKLCFVAAIYPCIISGSPRFWVESSPERLIEQEASHARERADLQMM